MPQFVNWVRLHDIDIPWNGMRLNRAPDDIPIPHYYAALAGMLPVVRAIMVGKVDINARCGLYGNALHAASSNGHERIVDLLLQHGADVHAVTAILGSALQEASFN